MGLERQRRRERLCRERLVKFAWYSRPCNYCLLVVTKGTLSTKPTWSLDILLDSIYGPKAQNQKHKNEFSFSLLRLAEVRLSAISAPPLLQYTVVPVNLGELTLLKCSSRSIQVLEQPISAEGKESHGQECHVLIHLLYTWVSASIT
ncbi:hypothetical protein CFP56_032706 [Quercus suber]|uniref:Uncharacterized protein n=1 Tax=Quercus suber TaxID=58331 RepID=A0AAW0JGX3_QUESU